MKYAIITALGLLMLSGCIADGPENMLKRDSSSSWYNEAEAYENNMSGFMF